MSKTIDISTNFDLVYLENTKPPLVSLYLPTHRFSPENQQDRIRFKNLITKAETSLAQAYNKREYEGITAHLNQLADNPDLSMWRCAKEGLAVLASNESASVYRLDYSVEELAIASNTFHIKPLIRNFQYGSHYFLLALASDRFDVFYGDFHTLEPLELPADTAKKFDELFNDIDDKKAPVKSARKSSSSVYFGFHSHASEEKVETIKFFQYVSKALTEYLPEISACPVILASLPEHQTTFRNISTIPHLLKQGIDNPVESMSEAELISRAAALITEIQTARIQKHVEAFGLAQAKESASSDPSTIAQALAEKRVSVLFAEEGVLIPGTFDRTMGTLSYDQIDNPCVDDLIDDFAQATYTQGGEVYVLNRDAMPSATGVAALFRY